VSLYYKFNRFNSDPQERFTGEGVVEVVDAGGAWRITAFDVIWQAGSLTR
jgi:hypothetical protein